MKIVGYHVNRLNQFVYLCITPYQVHFQNAMFTFENKLFENYHTVRHKGEKAYDHINGCRKSIWERRGYKYSFGRWSQETQWGNWESETKVEEKLKRTHYWVGEHCGNRDHLTRNSLTPPNHASRGWGCWAIYPPIVIPGTSGCSSQQLSKLSWCLRKLSGRQERSRLQMWKGKYLLWLLLNSGGLRGCGAEHREHTLQNPRG